MKSMDFFLKLQKYFESSIAENDILKKKLENSKATLANLRESYA